MGIEIYGVAFSGAGDGIIHSTYGDLLHDEKGDYLRIWGFGQHDDRLDLFESIFTAQANAMWALEAPFSLPVARLEKSGIDCYDASKARNALLNYARQSSRKEFLAWLDKHMEDSHCRATDAAVNAKNRLEKNQH